MARGVGSRTIDGSSILRCMVVALPPEQEKACRDALAPVEVVRCQDAREACASMSTVLPLAILVSDALSDTDRSTVVDMATACGAEVVVISAGLALDQNLGERLLDAVRIAERRRLGMRT